MPDSTARAVWAVITTREPNGDREHDQAVCFARNPTPHDEAQVFHDALVCALHQYAPHGLTFFDWR